MLSTRWSRERDVYTYNGAIQTAVKAVDGVLKRRDITGGSGEVGQKGWDVALDRSARNAGDGGEDESSFEVLHLSMSVECVG